MTARKDEKDNRPLNIVDNTRYFSPVPLCEIKLNPSLADGTSYPSKFAMTMVAETGQ